MKNDLNRNKITEEKKNADSPFENRSYDQVMPSYSNNEEPGFFNKLFKYTLILAACVAIPFAVNNDLWSDMKGAYSTATMVISDGETIPEPPQAPTAPAAPNANLQDEQINQIIQDALGNNGNYSFSTSGDNSVISFSNPEGESYNVVKDDNGNVIIENITGPKPIDGDALSRRIEEKISAKMAGLEKSLEGIGEQQSAATAEFERRIEEAASRMVKEGPNGEIIIVQQALQEITQNATQLGLAVSGQVLSGMGGNSGAESNPQNYLDFLSEMKSTGLYDDFQEWEMDNFHEAGLTAGEIQEWHENGLFNELQSYEVVSLAEDGISPQTVLEWKENGLLDQFQSYELASFYEKGISSTDVEEYVSFSNEYNIPLKGFEIASLVEENTSVAYLEKLADAGYLTKFPAYGWDDLESEGVTAEFMKDLDNRGILDGLEFYEVVNLYKKSN